MVNKKVRESGCILFINVLVIRGGGVAIVVVVDVDGHYGRDRSDACMHACMQWILII